MNRIYVVIGWIALLLLAGCKGKQMLPVQQPVSSEVESNFEALIASYPRWETFSSKGEVEVGLGTGKSLNASMQVKMIRGEALQISVRVLLGIEVARVVVTTDSVFVLNKMKQQLFAESLEAMSKRLATPLSVETIQDALLGRIFLLGSQANSYRLSDFDVEEGLNSQWTLSPKKQDNRFLYWFELQGTQLLTTRAGAMTSSKSVVCRYSDFVQQKGSENFPAQMTLALEGLSTPISLNLRYNSSSISWDSAVKIDNLNTSKYTRVSASQVLKML